MIDVSRLDPPPLGFGKCPSCPYLAHGSAAICFACASQTMEPLAASRCAVCELPFADAMDELLAVCNNPVCNWPDRGFDHVWAISMLTGTLRRAILRYKYEDAKGWAGIFGRVLAGFLAEHQAEFERFDLIVPSPTYVGADGRSWDHTDMILRAAALESDLPWPFDLDEPHNAIVQTAATPKFVDQKSWQDRRLLAEGQVRQELQVPEPKRVRGKSILVFEDVFTDGLRAREVALCLLRSKARDVSQVVLARQPFRKR